jgi:hypothetical protein
MLIPQLIVMDLAQIAVIGACLDCLILGTNSYMRPSSCEGQYQNLTLVFSFSFLSYRIVYLWGGQEILIYPEEAKIKCKVIDFLNHNNYPKMIQR